MATNWHNFKGIAKWAKVYEPDSFSGAENWKINLYFKDDAELKKFQSLGLELKIRQDDDGKFVTFRRPTKKVIKDDVVFFCPPIITGKVSVSYMNDDGDQFRQYVKGEYKGKVTMNGEKTLIGNGSKISVNICVYDTAKGKGHRLESIHVYELEQYEEIDSYDSPAPKIKPDITPEESTKKEKTKKIETKSSIEEDLNDEIPW